jgi:hypothetical protein
MTVKLFGESASLGIGTSKRELNASELFHAKDHFLGTNKDFVRELFGMEQLRCIQFTFGRSNTKTGTFTKQFHSHRISTESCKPRRRNVMLLGTNQSQHVECN